MYVIVEDSHRHTIFVNGKRIGIDRLAKMCRIGVREIKKTLKKSDRSQIIKEWLLKADAGVNSMCKTFWYQNCPIWVPIIISVTGVSPSTATWSR